MTGVLLLVLGLALMGFELALALSGWPWLGSGLLVLTGGTLALVGGDVWGDWR